MKSAGNRPGGAAATPSEAQARARMCLSGAGFAEIYVVCSRARRVLLRTSFAVDNAVNEVRLGLLCPGGITVGTQSAGRVPEVPLGVLLVFKNETKRAARSAMITGFAAAASVAVLGFASQAFAIEANPTGQYIKLEGASMVQSYTAYVGVASANEHAYSNGVTFSYQNTNAAGIPNNANVYTLYGFCIDVVHNMTLGGLNLVYSDTFGINFPANNDPVPNNFLLNGVTWTSAQALGNTTATALNKLIDTGWLLHEAELTTYSGAGAANTAARANIDLQLAAIQAAIWKTEGAFVNLGSEGSATAGNNVGGAIAGTTAYTYQQYYNYYSGLNFTNLGDGNDKFYTIIDTLVDVPVGTAHQGFAIGWPVPNVPEPATWAMLIVGFFGAGSALRRNRRKLALAAI